MTQLFLLVRVYLGAIWLLAGIGKLLDPTGRLSVPGWRLLERVPAPAVRFMAVGEVALGLLLIGGAFYPAVPLVSALPFTTFAIARLTGRLRGQCSCFGALRRPAALQKQILFWTGLSFGLAWLGDGALLRLPPTPLAVVFVTMLAIGLGAILYHWRRRSRSSQCPVCTSTPVSA